VSENGEILQYMHKDTFLHRLHPYIKIAFIIVVSVMSIIATDMVFLTLMVLAMLTVAAYSRLLAESLQQLKLIIVMSVIFILITIITCRMVIFSDTLFLRECRSSAVSSRLLPGAYDWDRPHAPFMILIFAFQLFLISTQPRDLVNAMEKIGLPIDYILIFIIALRFIPTLQIEGSVSTKPSWPGL